MHGDFSRVTFDAGQQYSRVLVQQGRAYLDAEANEQAAILLHSIRGTAGDLIGPHGTPSTASLGNGFRVKTALATASDDGFVIEAGVYYVDGIRCENPVDVAYFAQPDFFPVGKTLPAGTTRFLVYLDVWERHITHYDRLLLREVALGGPDGASRARVVWQVKVLEAPLNADNTTPLADVSPEQISRIAEGRLPADQPMLRARVKPGDVSTTPCITPPTGGYRGRENQLYRVEIHESGTAATATLKWSRDNGSIVFPITDLSASGVTVASIGLDPTRSLVPGNWVELLDDVAILHGRPGVLTRVTDAPNSRQIQLADVNQASPTSGLDLNRHPFLRRWDHRAGAKGAIPIVESADDANDWIDLEDGIQVQLMPRLTGQHYVSGDYWTIPARTATNGIEWPANGALRAWVPRSGVQHHYAPLAMMDGSAITRFRKVINMNVITET